MRCVCRSWSLLISDSHFIGDFSKFQASVKKRPYIISLYCAFQWPNKYKMKLSPEGDDYHCEFDVSIALVGSQFCTMSNSRVGLICFAGDAFTYLLNPSIQKVGALMKRSSHFNRHTIRSAGLGFNDFTGEYKVVRLFHRNVGQHVDLGCEVCTVGNLYSLSCWKVIDSPPFEPLCYSLPVFVNGAIHWTVKSESEKLVLPEIALSFDVKSEKFDVIIHPEGSSIPPDSTVVELGGLVCLACTCRDRVWMDIWALKDYNNREWIKQYIIDLSAMYDYIRRSLVFRTIIMHDGKIVFCDDRSRDYYDPQSWSFVKHIHGSIGSVTGV